MNLLTKKVFSSLIKKPLQRRLLMSYFINSNVSEKIIPNPQQNENIINLKWKNFNKKSFNFGQFSLFSLCSFLIYKIFGLKKVNCQTSKLEEENYDSLTKNEYLDENIPEYVTEDSFFSEVNNNSNNSSPHHNFKSAISISSKLIRQEMIRSGTPGLSVVVYVNGKLAWGSGFGYSNVENSVSMKVGTVLRIASISKPLTAFVVGQLIEQKKLDLDEPVHTYFPSFPKKYINGEEVTITIRHLLDHTSGIRHYKLKEEEESSNESSTTDELLEKTQIVEETKEKQLPIEDNVKEKRQKIKSLLAEKTLSVPDDESDPLNNEFDLQEYYIKEKFKSVKEALELFKDDQLLFEPGEKFSYSTHAFTLLSAVIESVAGKSFEKVMQSAFEDLNLRTASFDKYEDVIFDRARYYRRTKGGRLRNCPYVDNSYKWAGGGVLASMQDVALFGVIMLRAYQNTHDRKPSSILHSETVRTMWTPSPPVIESKRSYVSGLGWFIHKRFISHSGAAVGASTSLVILPFRCDFEKDQLPQGVVVSIGSNLQGMALTKLAFEISKLFCKSDRPVLMVAKPSKPRADKKQEKTVDTNADKIYYRLFNVNNVFLNEI